MKILLVNATDIDGGAARAAYRLHQALLVNAIDSQMLVQTKLSDDYAVLGPITKLQKGFAKIRPTLDALPANRYKDRTQTLFSPAWLPFSNIADRINAQNPDVVHLHWVAGGMARIEELARIKAPIVWSLHDMWPFTGGCHYDESCGGFRETCGSCKVLASSDENDLSRKIYRRKLKVFRQKNNITLVGLSRWIADEVGSSSLFSENRIVNLPNPIDTQVFAPYDKDMARELLNLPKNKKLILFGAMGATSDPRKGYKELCAALDSCQDRNAELIVFGASRPAGTTGLKQRAHYLGRLYDDITLRVLYSAADVMLVPSLQENLSNAIMESLACGTPVVGFDIGGNADLIDHKANGYLAKAYQTDDLARGLEWVINSDKYQELASNARKKILDNFDSRIVGPKYIDLYRSALNET